MADLADALDPTRDSSTPKPRLKLYKVAIVFEVEAPSEVPAEETVKQVLTQIDTHPLIHDWYPIWTSAANDPGYGSVDG